MMNIQYMEYFVVTADKQSISEAASTIFITSQGLNKALRKVESEYGSDLFYFSDGKFCLTDSGKKVYEYFKSILKLNTDLLDTVTKKTSVPSACEDTVTIFCSPIFTDTLIPQICEVMEQSTPDTKIKVIEYSFRNKLSVSEMITGPALFVFGAESSKVDALSRSAPSFNKRKILAQANVQAHISKKSSLASLSVITSENFLHRDLVLCRHEDFFLKKIDPSYSFSQIVTKSHNKNTCMRSLIKNSEAIGFTNAVELHYYNSPTLIAVPIEPKIEMKYGYFSKEEDMSIKSYSMLISALENEFKKTS